MWKLVCALNILAILIVFCESAPPKDISDSTNTPSMCGLLNHKLLKNLSDSCAQFRNHELPELINDDTRHQILCYIYDSNLNISCNSSQSNTLKFSELNEVDLEKSLVESTDSVCKNLTLIPAGDTVLKQLIKMDVICQRLCMDYYMKTEKLCSVSYFLRTFYGNADNKQISTEKQLPNIEIMPSNNQESKPENINKANVQIDTSSGKIKDINELKVSRKDNVLNDTENKVPQNAAAVAPPADTNAETQSLETTNIKPLQPIVTTTQNKTSLDQHLSVSAQEAPQLNPALQAQVSQQTASQSVDKKTPETEVKPPEPPSEQKPESAQSNNQQPLDNVQTSIQGKISSAQLSADLEQDDSENKFVVPNSKTSTPVGETPKVNEGANGKKSAVTPESSIDGNAEDDGKIEENGDEAGSVLHKFEYSKVKHDITIHLVDSCLQLQYVLTHPN